MNPLRRAVVIPDTDKPSIVQKIRDMDFKGALSEQLSIVTFRNRDNELFQKSTVCKENFMTTPTVVYTRKNFYLVNSLNHIIQQLKASGLVHYWHSKMLDKTSISAKASKQAQQLQIAHLQGSFQLWSSGLALSSIVFITELILKILVKFKPF